MRRRRHQRSTSVLIGAFVTSIVVHALVALPLREAANAYLARGSGKPPPVKVVRLSPDAWSKSMQAAQAARARRPDLAPSNAPPATEQAKTEQAKVEEKKKVEDKLSGQIVEVPPTPDDRQNPDAKYLSKYNSNVEKETTARPDLRDSSKKRVTNKLQSKEQAGAPENAVKTRGLTVKGDDRETDRDGAPGKEGDKGKQRFRLEVPDITRRDEVDLKLSDIPGSRRKQAVANRTATESLKGNSDQLRLEMGEGADDGSGESGGKRGDKNAPDAKSLPSLAALAPTIGTVARISGSPSRDFVEGVPEGEGTFLNAKEFKYATFFYRVRDSVATYWEDLASREYRRRDPSGNIYGIRDRATLLHIQLSPDGSLANVRVEQTSGVDFLDNVAVQAFRMAEPFPNPPAGIADQDGRIRFNFQFVVTMRSRSPLNLFKFK